MPLPDVDASRAVLIGTAGYRGLEPLPTVANNLEGLASLLQDPDLWGLPEAHCSVVLDPGSVDELLEVVHRAAQEATDTLLIYYAGHGLLDHSSDLLLTLPGSDTERMYRSVRYADIRREILDAVRCRDKAVILDCCYSGRAFMPAVQRIADQAVIDGTWLLTATAENKLALAPPDEHYTAFTGELIKVLDNGIVDGPDLIDTDALYLRMLHELKAKQRPEPQQRTRNQGHLITLVRNRARVGTTPLPAAKTPTGPPLDEVPYLRLTPKALAEKIAAMHAEGHADTAAAVLASCGRRRPDQEVASIMATFASLRRPHDVAAVAFAAASREPHELRRIYEILLEIEQRRLAVGLLKVVAKGLPERTARFLAVLDNAGAAQVLLRSAVGYSKERPQRLIDLVNALFLTQRKLDADLLLSEALRMLSAHDLAVVADALRDGGRDEQAYRLYGRAASAVVQREPTQIAAIVAALHKSGTPHIERLLAEQAITTRMQAPPEELAKLIAAFETAGLDHVVTDAIAALGGKLPRPVLAELTVGLRERGCESVAFRLYLAAAADRPIDDILRLEESLNEQGRPIDALNLLAHAAQVRSTADVERMTDVRGVSTAQGRTRRIFAAVAGQQQPARAASLYLTMAERNDGRIDQLRIELLLRPEADIVAVVAELLHAEATELADDLLRNAVRAVEGMTPQRLAAAAVRARDLRTVLHLVAVTTIADLPQIFQEVFGTVYGGSHTTETIGPARGDTRGAEAQIATLLPELPRRSIADVVAWARTPGQDHHGSRLMGALARLPVGDLVTITAAVARPDSTAAARDLMARVAVGSAVRIAELAAELRRRGERAHLRTLVEMFREEHRPDNDIFKLASWLWLSGEPDLALLVLRGRLWVTERSIDDALVVAVADYLHRYATSTGRLDVAYPVLAQADNAEELRRLYGLAADELGLFVLSAPRARKWTPIVFTDSGIHHINGYHCTYRDIRDLHVAVGRRSSVVLGGQSDAPADWVMPTAEAAKELVRLLHAIKALAQEFTENQRTISWVQAEPVPPGTIRRYELEGETS